MSQVTEQSVRFQTALASIKLIQASAVLDLTQDDFDFLTSNKVWIATDYSRARRCVEACVYGTLDFVGYPCFFFFVEFIAAVFFFQAEDGIRDAQESRGLGDVYKRQPFVAAARHLPDVEFVLAGKW